MKNRQSKKEDSAKIQHVVIIGAGPAGISAAIQLKRYGIEPVVIEKNTAGGLLKMLTWWRIILVFPKAFLASSWRNCLKNSLEQAELI